MLVGIQGGWLSRNLYNQRGFLADARLGAVFHDSVVPMAYSGGMEDEIQIPPLLILPLRESILRLRHLCVSAELIGEEKPGPTSGLLIPCSVIPANEGNRCWALWIAGIGSILLPSFSSNLSLESGALVGLSDPYIAFL